MEALSAKCSDQTEAGTALLSMQRQLDSIYQQLISNEKLTANALCFFGTKL